MILEIGFIYIQVFKIVEDLSKVIDYEMVDEEMKILEKIWFENY